MDGAVHSFFVRKLGNAPVFFFAGWCLPGFFRMVDLIRFAILGFSQQKKRVV